MDEGKITQVKLFESDAMFLKKIAHKLEVRKNYEEVNLAEAFHTVLAKCKAELESEFGLIE